ncbi:MULTISPECIES: hypothetical protein [unclassified Streptomyces]|uniref:SbtR family transcriptional regulator n=1 Tax=unclassified Streptomyces TaxID=2593676 RepID=UPI0035DAEEFF
MGQLGEGRLGPRRQGKPAALQIRAEELLARRTEIERITDADEALRQWMRALEDCLSAFSGLPEPLLAAIWVKESPLTVPCHTLIGITGDLLRTAQLNGNARTSVQADGDTTHAPTPICDCSPHRKVPRTVLPWHRPGPPR